MNCLSGTAQKTMEVFFRRNRGKNCPYGREEVNRILEVMDIYFHIHAKKNNKSCRRRNGKVRPLLRRVK